MLQPPEQIFLQPTEVYGGAEIHWQPLEGDHERAGCLKEAMTLWEVRTYGDEPMPQQIWWQNLGPCGDPHWSRSEELQPWDWTHVGAVCAALCSRGGPRAGV